jgi:hypothetical protein
VPDVDPELPLPVEREDLASVPVRVVSWQPLDAEAGSFVPQLHLAVNEAGEYRVLTPGGDALSTWCAGGPGAALLITCQSRISRTADGEYELRVERRIAGRPNKQYPIALTLKPTLP